MTTSAHATGQRERGAAAEALAARYLERQRLRIVGRNYRCRGGEIDLIAEDAGTTVFVEVRQRSSARFGGAAQSIDARKRARIVLAAQHYLASSGRPDRRCRFDVVLLADPGGSDLEWIRSAFDASP